MLIGFYDDVLSGNTGVRLKSEAIASRARWRFLGRTQKVRMEKCTPRHLFFLHTHMYILIFSNNNAHNIIIKILTSTSKSVYDYEEKNNLLS